MIDLDFIQPQNEYVEQSRKRRGYRLDHFEKKWVGILISIFIFLDCCEIMIIQSRSYSQSVVLPLNYYV